MHIFLSSTFIELRHHRDRAIDGIAAARHTAIGMEFFPAEPGQPLNVALAHLERADVVCLLVGFYGGSCIPDGSGSTYTEAEVDHARSLGKPVLAFIRTEGGSWQNKESKADARDALQRVHNFATSGAITPAYFESPHELEGRIAEALDRWEQRGRPGARRVFATWDEVYGPTVVQPLAYGHPLVGRDSELNALNQFWTGSPVLAVVSGRGGIGKSKLSRDWAFTLSPNVVALFVRDGAEWHPEVVKEVPVGDVVLVADDAHANADLPKFLALIRELRNAGRNVKGLVLTRPSGEHLLNSQISRRFRPDDVVRLPRLAPLRRADSTALAESLLQPEQRPHIPYLVAAAADTPLVLVVAADLINRGVVLPNVTRQDEFRRLVLDRLLDEYQAGVPGWTAWWGDLLDLIAAVGPVTQQSHFVQAAAAFLERSQDEILRAVDVMHARGLLSHRGGVHVVPDALADHLLEAAAFRPNGQPTGYVQRVFDAFGETHFPEILANAGEAEWQRTNAQGLLSSEIWRSVVARIEAARGWHLRSLLHSLERTAPYFPEQVLEIVDLVQRIAGELPDDERDDVLRELPLLLRGLRYHLDFVPSAAERLFGLAQSDRRAPHSYPDHAARVLEEMASYGRKPVAFNEEMLRVAIDLANRPGVFDGSYTPFDIVEQLLEREVELHDSDEDALRISTTGLNYRNVEALRINALAFIERLFARQEPHVQAKAFKVLQRLVGGTPRRLGRLPSAEEESWEDEERLRVLDILERRIDTGSVSPVLLHEIRSALTLFRPADANSVGQRIDVVLDKIPDSDDLALARTVCTGDWDFRDENNDFHGSEVRAQEARTRAVGIFVRRWPNAAEQVLQLDAILQSASDFSALEFSAAGRFATELLADDDVLNAALHHMLAHPDGALAQFMSFALSVLRAKRPRVYARFAKRLVRPGGREAFAYAATQVAAYAEPTAGDLVVLASSLRRDTLAIRKMAINGLGRTLALLRSDDLALMIIECIRLDHELVEAVSDAVENYVNADPSVSVTVVQTFFERLIDVPKLDGYHVLATIAKLAATHPAQLVDFLLARLRRSASEGWRYDVVPGSVARDLDGTALQGWSGYSEVLQSVIAVLSTPGIKVDDVAEIFWACGGLDSAHLSLLDDLAHNGAPVEHLVALIRRAPGNLATANPMFASHIIEVVGELPKVRKDVVGAFIGNATPHGWSRTRGEPAPVWITLRDQGQQLAERFPAAADLFNALRDYAERSIRDDEALDSRDE